jgi:optic atrophy 3 protein
MHFRTYLYISMYIYIFLKAPSSYFVCVLRVFVFDPPPLSYIHILNTSIYRIAKLAGLIIKTLSKPLSKRIKHEFSKSTTGTRLLESMGQASHNITSRMTIWSAGYKVRNIQPLPSDKAILMGSELVGESFVLFVSAGVIIYEYQRSKLKEMEKAEKANAKATQERYELQQQLNAIHTRIEAIEQTISVLLPKNEGEVNESGAEPASTSTATNTKSLLQLLYWWRK